MSSSTLNCVAERVMEHFTNAQRGNKLTEQRRKKITEWGLTVKDGATINDVEILERKLKFLISVKTLTGEVLYDGKYKSKGAPIEIIVHNSHAWTSAVTIFPRERTIRYTPEDCTSEEKLFDFIAQLSKTDPVSVWLLRSDQDPEMDLINFQCRMVNYIVLKRYITG